MSKSTYSHDVVATIGKYKDAQGNEKKRYTNIGKAFTNEDGNMSIKLDTVPVGPEWSGWISLYEAKPRDERRQTESQPQRKRENQPDPGAYRPQPDDDDSDVPF